MDKGLRETRVQRIGTQGGSLNSEEPFFENLALPDALKIPSGHAAGPRIIRNFADSSHKARRRTQCVSTQSLR